MLELTSRSLMILLCMLSAGLMTSIIIYWTRAARKADKHGHNVKTCPISPSDQMPAKSAGQAKPGKAAALARLPQASKIPGPIRLGLAILGRTAVLITSHIVLLLIVLIFINNQPGYGFFANWRDLYNQTKAVINPDAKFDEVTAPVEDPTKLDAGQGSVETQTIAGKQVLFWLPPNYHSETAKGTKYPVLFFLPGQPSGPSNLFKQFYFGKAASEAIANGKISPFIAVLPPIMVNPPQDTECTDVPQGPQAESWLVTTLPTEVRRLYRTQPAGRYWSVAGFSTGGFCSAKLALKHPKLFASGADIGGHLIPWGKNNEALNKLFKGDAALLKANTPLEIYKTQGTRGAKLLVISSVEDKSSYPQVHELMKVSRGDPTVQIIQLPSGGHNFIHYAGYLPTTLEWIGSTSFNAAAAR